MEILKSLVRDGAMLYTFALSIWAETPSGPLAVDESMREKTSSVVQRSSSGQESNCTVCCPMSASENGGISLLKQVEKNQLSRVAFSELVLYLRYVVDSGEVLIIEEPESQQWCLDSGVLESLIAAYSGILPPSKIASCFIFC